MSQASTTPPAADRCPYCDAATRHDIIRLALWEGDRLVVIDGVPARVCEGCFEQFFDDGVTFKIDYLRGLRFPAARADRVLEVPVFAFDALSAGGEP
jgi:YgiT-type zinc finger domain-containing protein